MLEHLFSMACELLEKGELQRIRIVFLVMAGLFTLARPAHAQGDAGALAELHAQQARNNAGARVGTWNVADPSVEGSTYKASPTMDLFMQRGISEHTALESSLSLWRRVTTTNRAGSAVTTKSYLFPLLSSLKYYPFTRARRRLQPYLSAGVGFGLGIQKESTNAIGGGGTTVVTGFGMKLGVGTEYHIAHGVGILVSGRYLWMKFSDKISDQQTFSGTGVEAGVTYKFRIS